VDKKYITKSDKETKKIGEVLAKGILKTGPQKMAKVLCLYGDLGAGKTTFTQGFAKGLGIKEKILSPTFVIMKRFGNFYHIDCYRLKDHKDILELEFKKIISDPANIVLVEWPEIIKKVLPKKYIKVNFKFIDQTHREISYKI
jgi:tRNA threonylcarbamoyladenosine biosynthesis protein TsaE